VVMLEMKLVDIPEIPTHVEKIIDPFVVGLQNVNYDGNNLIGDFYLAKLSGKKKVTLKKMSRWPKRPVFEQEIREIEEYRFVTPKITLFHYNNHFEVCQKIANKYGKAVNPDTVKELFKLVESEFSPYALLLRGAIPQAL